MAGALVLTFWNRAEVDGDLVTGGDIVGVVYENGLFRKHYIMVPPMMAGRVKTMKPAGNYKTCKTYDMPSWSSSPT